MEFADVIRARRAVRKYADRPVEDEKLQYVLEAARLAPSASNKQPVTFVVVRDRETIARIGKPSGMINTWLSSVPAILVACSDRERTSSNHGVEFWQVDAAIAIEHLVLAAVDAGLGTCWIGAFDEPEVRATLGIPSHMGIVALVPIGYPAERMSAVERMTRQAIKADRRKPMSDLVRWETW